jgi:phage antirepressor YoqD-like protein
MEIMKTDSLRMSSRDIAELTEKRHDHVLVDIREMIVALHGEGGCPTFRGTYIHPQNGQTYPMFMLPKRETLILVSGYRVDLRAKIIDRWQELETQLAGPSFKLPDFSNPAAAARAWADAIDEKKAAETIASQAKQQLAIAAPKVEAFDVIATSQGSMNMSDAAKVLQSGPKKLIMYMSCANWIFKRIKSENWVAYQTMIDRGYLEHKLVTFEIRGVTRSEYQVMVTPKGITKLAEEFGPLNKLLG